MPLPHAPSVLAQATLVLLPKAGTGPPVAVETGGAQFALKVAGERLSRNGSTTAAVTMLN